MYVTVRSTASSIYRPCSRRNRVNARATARIESPETSSSDSGLEECGTSPIPMADSSLHSFGNGLLSLERRLPSKQQQISAKHPSHRKKRFHLCCLVLGPMPAGVFVRSPNRRTRQTPPQNRRFEGTPGAEQPCFHC